MRRPYMFLGRSARRLERKIGRTVAAGGVAGAVVASNSRKADTAKGNTHTRPNHDTASDTSTFGKRAGAKVGAVLDGKDGLKDKAKSIRQQVDIVNIGLHFFLKNVRPHAASCSEA